MLKFTKVILGCLVLFLLFTVSSLAQISNTREGLVQRYKNSTKTYTFLTVPTENVSRYWQKERERPVERDKEKKNDRREPPRGEKKDEKKKKPD
jgi:hypothetical protein